MLCKPLRLFQMLLVLLAAAAAAAAAAPSNTLPNCLEKCGDVPIPYPFGVGSGCYREGFEITCNATYNPPRPFFSNVEITNISLPTGELRIFTQLVSHICYNSTSLLYSQSRWASVNLMSSFPAYRFSSKRNKFTAIGCRTLGYIRSATGYASGCLSMCSTLADAQAGPCAGLGCCQTAIPNNLAYYNASFDRNYNNTQISSFNPCSYAFLAESDWFQLDLLDLAPNEFHLRHKNGVPLVLDWAIRNETTCEEAVRDPKSYACVSKNSFCLDSTNGPGYLCNCSEGYEGNPYLSDGCQDINECDNPEAYSCHGACTNVPGSYKCACPPGRKGDPTRKDGCQRKFSTLLKIVTGTSVGIFLAFIIGFWSYLGFEKKKLITTKRRFFEHNGGFFLQQQINSYKGVAFKIFTKEELERATNKFDQDRVIGRGGHGTVYKGVLEDKRIVAIKRSTLMDENQKKEFAREMLILSQINHINVVKLLGCCLEVEVPMLVYEFVSNGTLFQFIHDKHRRTPIPLDTRLRIAMESAQALAYLHSFASPPIIHGDVKPSNILLDDNYTARVSDFGASKLALTDEAQLATLVQGTWGYLDPEYLQTCQLTERSDVYSFGVVLLELLTGKKALSFEGSEEERSLVSIFISAMQENRLHEIIDIHVINEGGIELVKEVADLAARCLNFRGEERPTMKAVADALESLRKLEQHPWVPHNPEEIENLLGELVSAPETIVYDSLAQRSILDIETGR